MDFLSNFNWNDLFSSVASLGNLFNNLYGGRGGGGGGAPAIPAGGAVGMASGGGEEAMPFDMSGMMEQWQASMASWQEQMQAQMKAQQDLFKDQQMKTLASQAGRMSKDMAARGLTSGAMLDPNTIAQYMNVDDMELFKGAINKYGDDYGLSYG